ncbi:MAG: patatin-like phospholipase family protein, partial [Hyphomicrobium sp.]
SEALFGSAFLFERALIREKLKSQQPDILIDAGMSRFQVLDFLKAKEILAAAEPAKELLKRQLGRLMDAETVEALAPPSPPAATASPPAKAKRHLFKRSRRRAELE